MTAPKTPKTTKPKKLSKTKQELRRLRDFASMFYDGGEADGIRVGGMDIMGAAYKELRDRAAYALTGKKSDDLSNHEAVAADVARLNAMGPKGLEKFLAGK